MDYQELYGLQEPPFSSALDERFYYNSPQHSRSLARLVHAVENRRGLAVLFGDIGTGKSMLAHRMLNFLSSDDLYDPSLMVIIHSEISPLWLLSKIAVQFGVVGNFDSKTEIVPQLYDRLMEINEDEKIPVVLIDEANMLQTREIMEELRGLLNLQGPSGYLLSFVLYGLPELDRYLKLDGPLYQRIAIRCQLDPLNEESTTAYITHRLKVAGCDHQLFDKKTLTAIYRYSKGRPRLINTLCDNILFEAYLEKSSINKVMVANVAEELGLTRE
jgi:general secretion pathway protein A